MNIEEPVFCIIHNYRRPKPDTQREVQPLNEIEIDQLDSLEAGQADLATQSSLNEEGQSFDNVHK